MNYFLAPRSGETKYNNFESTIKHGIPLSRISPFLNSDEINILSTEEIIYAWGNQEGTKSPWYRMEYGDRVIFCTKGKLVISGEVYFKKHDPELALAMWPRGKNGRPWEYTFFLKNLKYFSLPLAVFNPIVGYKLNYSIQGFSHLKEFRVEKIKEQYGSVESLLNLFKDENSADIPTLQDKVYVNIPNTVEPIIMYPQLRPKANNEVIKKYKAKKKKIDYELRNRNNTITGSKGEELVLAYVRKRLVESGKFELAERVKRISIEDDTLGYDIISFNEDGTNRYVEVKTTSLDSTFLHFYVSTNEYFIGKNTQDYYIYFVEKINTNRPMINIIKNPMDESQFNIKPDGYVFEAER